MMLWAPLSVGALAAIAAACALPLVVKLAEVRALRRRCRLTRTLVLTYDDGPGAELTPAILKLLAEADARATFFPTARSALANPELLSQVAAAGHEIGCHSAAHLHAWKVLPWRAMRDVRAGFRALTRWVEPDGLYRPPYGKINLPTWWAVRRQRAAFAWWTVDSGDTHATLPNPQAVVAAVRGDGGGVVLLHDFDRNPPTRAARHAHVLEVTAGLLRLARDTDLRVCTFGALRSPPAGAQRSPIAGAQATAH